MVNASHGRTPFVKVWGLIFGFRVCLPTHYRVVSHALLCRRSDAEGHTAQVVPRDVGLRPAVPLPAVALLLRVLLKWTRRFAFCKA